MRDVEGYVLWRVRVVKDEVTCLRCGEFYSPKWFQLCPRCNEVADTRVEPVATPTVPTVSYLRADEFEMVR